MGGGGHAASGIHGVGKKLRDDPRAGDGERLAVKVAGINGGDSAGRGAGDDAPA